MENNKNKLYLWIAIAVVVVAVIAYFVVTGGIDLSGGPNVIDKNAPVGEETDMGTVTEKGVVAAPGTSAISTTTEKVVTPEGKEVKNNVTPGSPEAPQQSNPIAPEQLPPAAVKVEVSASGFSPKEFSVKSGAPIVLSITSVDTQTHIFAFNDPSLSAVAVGVGPGETRAITFNAPDKSGEYSFYCNVPGHASRGETGKMIVK